MALDDEDSMADEDTISDASGESLVSRFPVSQHYKPGNAVLQTADTGLQESMRRFPLLDQPRPVRRRDRIIQI
jgi:hypothetical protein